jgi:hypothetical protein
MFRCGSAWKSRMILAFSLQRYNPDHLHDPQQIVYVLASLLLYAASLWLTSGILPPRSVCLSCAFRSMKPVKCSPRRSLANLGDFLVVGRSKAKAAFHSPRPGMYRLAMIASMGYFPVQ